MKLKALKVASDNKTTKGPYCVIDDEKQIVVADGMVWSAAKSFAEHGHRVYPCCGGDFDLGAHKLGCKEDYSPVDSGADDSVIESEIAAGYYSY